MIVVDTSALMAILKAEPQSDGCIIALAADPNVLISAGTMAEALIVAAGRNLSEEMTELIEKLGCDIVAVGAASAKRVAQAHARWGKGRHRAGLNFGDCFAYALAKERDCPLLFVGRDFSATDISIVLPRK